MKHALIIGHPSNKSFNASIAAAYEAAVRAAGDEIVVRDLYDMNFEPRLSNSEVPRPDGFFPAADAAREREIIGGADVFAFVYPLWFYAPPAIVLGYIQRVFGMGFGYGEAAAGANARLLTGKRLIVFTSSGAPTQWMMGEGGWEAVRNIFIDHFAQVCGIEIVDHVHFGRVTPGMRADAVDECLEAVGRAVARIRRDEACAMRREAS